MDDSLRELYQQVILDHNKNPRNHKPIDPHTHEADGHNPLCGDKLKLFLNVEGGIIKDVSFEGSGCAISTASASLMTESLKGRSLGEAKNMFAAFHRLVTLAPAEDGDEEILDKLAVFAGIGEFPVRVKCATLAWHTMQSALDGKQKPASTE